MEKVREKYGEEQLKLKREFEIMHSKTIKVDIIDGSMRLNGDSPDPNNEGEKDFSQLDQMLLDDQSILNKQSARMMGIIEEQSEKNDSNSGSDSNSPRKITETQPFNNDFTKSELWVLQGDQRHDTHGSMDEERAQLV
jgi:hypothetical protein